MKRFELFLKNEKIKSYRRMAMWLISVQLAGFVLLAIRSNQNTAKIICIVTAVVLSGLLAVDLFFNNGKKNRYQTMAWIAGTISWMLLNYWVAAGVSLILFFLFLVSVKPLKIMLSSNDITVLSFPTRTFNWIQLSNVVLKDDILTIDFKNNKLLQTEIDNGANVINEKEFNDFCKQHLNINKASQ